MPRKPKRPCSFPGCPELTDGRYCDMHQRQEDAYYNKYERRILKASSLKFILEEVWYKL